MLGVRIGCFESEAAGRRPNETLFVDSFTGATLTATAV